MSRRSSLCCLWAIGSCAALYLAFAARPPFGLAGLWAGLAVGLVLRAVAAAGLAVTADWPRAVLRGSRRRLQPSIGEPPHLWRCWSWNCCCWNFGCAELDDEDMTDEDELELELEMELELELQDAPP